MKSLFSCFIVALLCSQTIYAQRNEVGGEHENFFRVGAKAGLQLHKIKDHKLSEGFAYNYQLGGFTQFNLSKKLGIQPEVNFSQYRGELTKDATIISEDIASDAGQKFQKFNYLEIPLLVNLNVGPSKRIKLQAGPSFNKLIGKNTNNDSGIENKDNNLSMVGGIWIQLPFINLSARYNHLLGEYDMPGRMNYLKQSATIAVGFTF